MPERRANGRLPSRVPSIVSFTTNEALHSSEDETTGYEVAICISLPLAMSGLPFSRLADIDVEGCETRPALVVRPCCCEVGAIKKPAKNVEIYSLDGLAGMFHVAVLDEDDGRLPPV